MTPSAGTVEETGLGFGTWAYRWGWGVKVTGQGFWLRSSPGTHRSGTSFIWNGGKTTKWKKRQYLPYPSYHWKSSTNGTEPHQSKWTSKMGGVPRQFRLPLEYLHPILGCWFKAKMQCFLSSFQLVVLGDNRWYLKGSLPPTWETGWCFCLLASTLGAKPVNERDSLPTPLPLSLSLCLSLTHTHTHSHFHAFALSSKWR